MFSRQIWIFVFFSKELPQSKSSRNALILPMPLAYILFNQKFGIGGSWTGVLLAVFWAQYTYFPYNFCLLSRSAILDCAVASTSHCTLQAAACYLLNGWQLNHWNPCSTQQNQTCEFNFINRSRKWSILTLLTFRPNRRHIMITNHLTVENIFWRICINPFRVMFSDGRSAFCCTNCTAGAKSRFPKWSCRSWPNISRSEIACRNRRLRPTKCTVAMGFYLLIIII
jgi:hypothetical protein